MGVRRGNGGEGYLGHPFVQRHHLAFRPWASLSALCWWLLSSVGLAQVSTEQHLVGGRSLSGERVHWGQDWGCRVGSRKGSWGAGLRQGESTGVRAGVGGESFRVTWGSGGVEESGSGLGAKSYGVWTGGGREG